MQARFYIQFLALLAFITVLVSCDDSKNFPDEPVINSLTWDDSLEHLIIEFTDGDGDFGLDPDDPNFPLWLDSAQTMENPYYYNLWIDYFERRDGKWVYVEPKGTFNFRIGILTPAGQNKQLKVKITNDLSTEIPYLLTESDTIRFTVKLIDRSRKESLPVTTDAIYAPS